MPDMLVKLYNLNDEIPNLNELKNNGIQIKRALAPDKHKILAFIKDNFNEYWSSECDVAFSNTPISCFIATKNKTIIGFGCYDATAPNFFGPTGIKKEYRAQGIGKALLCKCLLSMKDDGYGYAIIGGVNEAIKFYQKTVNASIIEDSSPGIYRNLIGIE